MMRNISAPGMTMSPRVDVAARDDAAERARESWCHRASVRRPRAVSAHPRPPLQLADTVLRATSSSRAASAPASTAAPPLGLPPRNSQLILRRAHRRRGRLTRILQRSRFDTSEQRAFRDGLRFFHCHFEHDAAELGAYRGFTRRRQLAGDDRADDDRAGLHRDDVLRADLNGERRGRGALAFDF